MNEILENIAKDAAEKGLKTAEEVYGFVNKQAPELFNEIIWWGALSEVIAPLMGLILLIVCGSIHLKLRKNDEDNWYNSSDIDRHGPAGFIWICGVSVLAMIMFLVQVMDVIYPLIAPRLYLIEKISTLIK